MQGYKADFQPNVGGKITRTKQDNGESVLHLYLFLLHKTCFCDITSRKKVVISFYNICFRRFL